MLAPPSMTLLEDSDSRGVTGTAMKTCSKRQLMRMKPGSVTCRTGVTQDVCSRKSKLNCWVFSFINEKSVVFVWVTGPSHSLIIGQTLPPKPVPEGLRLHVNTKQVVKVCTLAKMWLRNQQRNNKKLILKHHCSFKVQYIES